jgi:hypothetical protein
MSTHQQLPTVLIDDGNLKQSIEGNQTDLVLINKSSSLVYDRPVKTAKHVYHACK